MKKTLTLYELNGMVRAALDVTFTDAYWVEAELSEVRERGGHCYMELVQKDALGNTPVARASAICWRSVWLLARPHFERVTGESLRPSMQVLLQVRPQFHEAYGFSWIVVDIDPTFTLGDMARKRREIVAVLKAEGVFDLNKELRLPLFAQRIAVVSSETAAGYGDFCDQLGANDFGFSFSITLFPAVMQGRQVEQSVIAALDAVNADADNYDCVVIIRGGGATSDLSAFDSLLLAENVANFPLPVITGIGHDRDESVVDMVANTRVKTPTAAATLLVDNLKRTSDRIEAARASIVSNVRRRMDFERMRISRMSERVPVVFSLVRTRQEARVDSLYGRMRTALRIGLDAASHRVGRLSSIIAPAVGRRLMSESHRLEMLSQRAAAADPLRLLKRGYTITLHEGHAVRSAAELADGDVIETRFSRGKVKSKVSKG